MREIDRTQLKGRGKYLLADINMNYIPENKEGMQSST